MLQYLDEISRIERREAHKGIIEYIGYQQDIHRFTKQRCFSKVIQQELIGGFKASSGLIRAIADGLVVDAGKTDAPCREAQGLANLIHGVEDRPELVSAVIEAANDAATPYVFLSTLETVAQRCRAKSAGDSGRFAELGQFKFKSVLRHLDTLCHRKDWERAVTLVQASVRHPDAPQQLTIEEVKEVLGKMYADHAPEACVDLLHAFKESPTQIGTVDPRILEALPKQLESKGRQDKVQLLADVLEALASRRQRALSLSDPRRNLGM